MTEGFDLARFHAGDDAYFADLVRIHSPRLRPYLRRFDGDPDDLLQEVWLRAYRKRASFAATGSFIGWLLSICRTVGLRGQKRHEPLHDDVAHSEHDPIEALELERRRDSFRAAVQELPERQRDVVLLRIVEGRTTAETARILSCAEGTVKATLHHAIANLQTMLRQDDGVSGNRRADHRN